MMIIIISYMKYVLLSKYSFTFYFFKLFKKFLMPCGICAAVPVIKSKDEPTSVSNEQKKLVRPSELPIYTFEKAETREPPW